jgi:hypothetical protein
MVRETALLSRYFAGPLVGFRCETCEGDVDVWAIGGKLYCGAECALKGLAERQRTALPAYLAELRVRATVLSIYDDIQRSRR